MQATVIKKEAPVSEGQDLRENVLRKEQTALLEQVDPSKKYEQALPENYLPFLKTEFTAEYEQYVRGITNIDGQHNSAYNPEEWKKMPPQDKLVKAWGWFHGVTGFSSMFLWASGRQDAYVILDIPEPTEEQKTKRKAELDAFRPHIEKFHLEVNNVA